MEWRCRLRRGFPLAIILLSSFVLRLQNLGHPGLNYFDESFHAIVARNLLKHPLKPTLIDDPVLTYDAFNWNENHVWLHKPILALWQIAAAYSLLGVNTFALRFPSLVLSTGAVLLTYMIGRELFDRTTALIASGFQAVNPAVTSLVQGYMFSDHIDIALLFWVELGIYLVIRATRSGSWRDIALAGIVQGLAYLTKSYLAALISGIAVTAWLLSHRGREFAGASRIRFRHLVAMACATVITVAPWTIYCLIHYPREFLFEHGYVWAHLHSRIEVWGAPWDRVVFDYLIALYHVLYTPVIVAAIALLGTALKQRSLALWIVYAWAALVLTPHLLAATKTPSATLIGMPALFLLLGHMISQAINGDRWLLAGWTGIVVASVIYPAPIRPWGRGYPDPPVFAGVMVQSLWVICQLAAALGVALLIWRRMRLGDDEARRIFTMRNIQRVALAGTVLLCAQSAYTSWRVTKSNRQEPNLAELTRFIQQRLPKTAVFICEGRDLGEHQSLMWLADRPCYSLNGRPIEVLAHEAIDRGYTPYVVSSRTTLEPALYRSHSRRLAIYDWRPTVRAVREERSVR